MSRIRHLRYLMLASTILLALVGPALAQPANAPDTATPPAAEEGFSQPAPKQTAIDLIAKKVSAGNSRARASNNDDEIYASGYFGMKIADPVAIAEQRDMFALIAWHSAQSDLLNSIYSTFEASSIFEMPGSPIESKFKDQAAILDKQINDVQEKIKAAAYAFDQTEGQEVESELNRAQDVKFVDRASALLDAVIKRIDSDYSPQKLADQKDEAARKRTETLKLALENSKARLEQLQVQMKDLNAKMKDEKDKLTTTLNTSVNRVASMPLLGATVVNMAESYINGEYQIAFAMKWSKKNEKIARAILKGEVLKDDPVPGRTLADWLSKLNKGTMLGSRVFTDENGDVWYLGVGSYPTEGGGERIMRAKTTASVFADRSLMFALLANAASYQSAVEMQETASSKLVGDDSSYATSTAAKLVSKIGKTVVPNKRILVDEPAINPVTGQEVWVQVVAVNATSSQKALEQVKDTVAKVIDITRYQVDQQGRLQGLNDAQNDAAAQAKAIETETAIRTKQEMLASPKPAPASPAAPTAKSGSIMNGSTLPNRKPGGLSTGGGYDDE